MTALGDVMVTRGGSLNPSAFPDEKFELYSIPAHDRGGPEISAGSAIGSSKQLVRPGDVMISKIIPHIRRARVVGPSSGRRQIASGEWIVFRGDSFEPNFLRHFLLSDGFHHQFMNTVAGVGGSLVRARPAQVKSIVLPLPPRPEQRRIAAILDHADALRAKRRQVLTHLDSLTQSIFHNLFGNADGWPRASIGSVGTVTTGRTPPSAADGMFGGSIPFVTPGDLGSENSAARTVTEAGAAASRVVRAGSTFVCCIGATIGKVGIATQQSALNQQINAVEWDSERIDDAYGLAAMRRLKPVLVARGASTTLPLLPKGQFVKLEISVPPISLQRAYAGHADRINARRAVIQCALSANDELFASLQSRAFQGEL